LTEILKLGEPLADPFTYEGRRALDDERRTWYALDPITSFLEERDGSRADIKRRLRSLKEECHGWFFVENNSSHRAVRVEAVVLDENTDRILVAVSSETDRNQWALLELAEFRRKYGSSPRRDATVHIG
jgi:hypothetical protein